MSWHQNWISNTGNRSLAFRDQKSWDQRSPEEIERLEFLRRKQQPWVNWDVDWEKFVLKDDISKNCAFQAGKVSYPGEEGLVSAVIASANNVGAITHIWETYRLKAVLRSGKMLPYDLMKRIGPSSHWATIEKWIEAEGELPELSLEVQAAVREVQTKGYQDVLRDLMAGEVALNGSARQKQENRALSLVTDILKSWEAARNTRQKRPTAQILERQAGTEEEDS